METSLEVAFILSHPQHTSVSMYLKEWLETSQKGLFAKGLTKWNHYTYSPFYTWANRKVNPFCAPSPILIKLCDFCVRGTSVDIFHPGSRQLSLVTHNHPRNG